MVDILFKLSDELLSDPEGIDAESYSLLLDLFEVLDVEPDFIEFVEFYNNRFFYKEDE